MTLWAIGTRETRSAPLRPDAEFVGNDRSALIDRWNFGPGCGGRERYERLRSKKLARCIPVDIVADTMPSRHYWRRMLEGADGRRQGVFLFGSSTWWAVGFYNGAGTGAKFHTFGEGRTPEEAMRKAVLEIDPPEAPRHDQMTLEELWETVGG